MLRVLTFLLYLLFKQSLLLLVVLGGMGFAVARWKRHPRISLMTVLALGLYLITDLTFRILYHWLPDYLYQLHLTAQTISRIDSSLQVLDDFIYAAVLILLVAAAFTGRDRPSFTINQRTS
jgi:hypothetical protein